VLTRLVGAPAYVLALVLVAALHLVPLPTRTLGVRSEGALAPTRTLRVHSAGATAPTRMPRTALEDAHAERRAGALAAAELRYSGLATDLRAPSMLREEATYWSLHVRLAAGDPLARAALAGFIQRARSPDLVLRAAGLACSYARHSVERRHACSLAHEALRAQAEVATDDGRRWRAALARLTERAESTENFFREKSEKPLHSASDCP
jgi:hypothetical protein